MKRKGIAALLTMSMVLAAGGTGGAVVSAAEDPVTFKVAVMLNPLCKDEDFNNQEAYKRQRRPQEYILSGSPFLQQMQMIK